MQDVCRRIRNGDSFPYLTFTETQQADALIINIDESVHATMCHDLIEEIAKHEGEAPLPFNPGCAESVEAIRKEVPPQMSPYVDLMFVIVSETTITGILRRTPHDLRVNKRVRNVLRDHAEDEVYHQQFFSKMFTTIWSQFTDSWKTELGTRLPSLIKAFLLPDESALVRMLTHLNIQNPSAIAAETMRLPMVRERLIASATPTLEMLEQNEVFRNHHIYQAFRNAGFPASE